ncbi:hypothetical protein RI129_011883 [Pyrocoelia pectoralis]|uniref:DUF7869 domain-containing protein n=1 Tax=Pyrocoelia pectoralis TaxID=417401 RepID=A0AAN7V6K4_9COLE
MCSVNYWALFFLPSRCPMKCFTVVSEQQRQEIFARFYNMDTKTEQDIYLQGQIAIKEVARRRKRKENAKDRLRAYEHYITINQVRKKVCEAAFLSIHAVGRERLKRIKRLLISGEVPKDKRGTNAKANVVGPEIREIISNHIKSFPVKGSHYSGKEYRYLDARLNVKIMYQLFKVKYPKSDVKYSYYLKFFHENFQLHFGRPQVDTCNVCEELNVKIKSPKLGDPAKRAAVAEKVVHCRRSKKFYTALQNSAVQCKERNDLVALSLDYMQNMQLPEIPVQDLFYLTQLSVSVFCIYNLGTKKAMFYLYHEGVAAKSPNEICSLLMDYIQNYIGPEVKELHLFSDNCPGQNKNHCVTRMSLALTDTGRFNKIQHFFPIRGHSFLPCDRAFGLVKRNLKKFDRIYDLHKYTEIIAMASAQHAFTIKRFKQKILKTSRIGGRTIIKVPLNDKFKYLQRRRDLRNVTFSTFYNKAV